MLIEKQMTLRKNTPRKATLEITLPIAWVKSCGLKAGDSVKVLANNLVIVLPPDNDEEERRARTFLERKT
jgi:antitoxin component of MazEF toxin-antitoxin module